MSENTIDFELRGRVRSYLQYFMHKESNHKKQEEILNKLTEALKNEVIFEANSKYLFEIPLFSKNFSINFIENLAFAIKQVRYSPEEYIFHVIIHNFPLFINLLYQKGEINDLSMYIVAKGNLDLVNENEYGIKSLINIKVL